MMVGGDGCNLYFGNENSINNENIIYTTILIFLNLHLSLEFAWICIGNTPLNLPNGINIKFQI